MRSNFITAAALAGVMAFAAAQAEAREYKIGFIGPMSGGAANLGIQMERGAKLYEASRRRSRRRHGEDDRA